MKQTLWHLKDWNCLNNEDKEPYAGSFNIRGMDMKKIVAFMKSMKLSIVLLMVLGAASVVGTVIPQNESPQFYTQNYGSLFNSLREFLDLDNVYFSWWYIAITGLLSVNLTTCIILRLPRVIRQIKTVPEAKDNLAENNFLFKAGSSDVEKLFEVMGFKKPVRTGDNTYASAKSTFGHLGSWLLHLGILFIMVFFTLGNIFAYETNLYGVPGTMGKLEGKDLYMKINSFNVNFRDDYTVEQYISNIDILNKEGDVLKSGDVSVNSPLRYNHYSFYQNSMGYAVNLKVYKENQSIYEDVFYQSEVYVNDDKSFAVQFVSFYPDMEMTAEGPRTKSPRFDNPHMLYVIFYNGYMAGMNVSPMGRPVSYGEYSFTVDNPTEFTQINIRRDLFTPMAMAGAAVLLVGIILTFYFVPMTLYAKENQGEWSFYLISKKNVDTAKSNLLFKYENYKRGESYGS